METEYKQWKAKLEEYEVRWSTMYKELKVKYQLATTHITPQDVRHIQFQLLTEETNKEMKKLIMEVDSKRNSVHNTCNQELKELSDIREGKLSKAKDANDRQTIHAEYDKQQRDIENKRNAELTKVDMWEEKQKDEIKSKYKLNQQAMESEFQKENKLYQDGLEQIRILESKKIRSV